MSKNKIYNSNLCENYLDLELSTGVTLRQLIYRLNLNRYMLERNKDNPAHVTLLTRKINEAQDAIMKHITCPEFVKNCLPECYLPTEEEYEQMTNET